MGAWEGGAGVGAWEGGAGRGGSMGGGARVGAWEGEGPGWEHGGCMCGDEGTMMSVVI